MNDWYCTKPLYNTSKPVITWLGSRLPCAVHSGMAPAPVAGGCGYYKLFVPAALLLRTL